MVSWIEKIGLGLRKSSQKIGGGISAIFTRKKLDAETLDELEELLITADMGVKTAAKIVAAFGKMRQDREISDQEIRAKLAEEIGKILLPTEKKFVVDRGRKPFVILFAGVNGAGKTTTIGKLATKLKKQCLKVSLIAGDTFRAAAVEQLRAWGERAGVRVFAGADGCDSAGLCFDGLQKAMAEDDDVVFVDTAGRLQNKSGLMDELKKMVRVMQKVIADAPHECLLVLDATTGQNALSQVEIFKQCVPLTGLVMTKLDGTAKGGVLAAIAGENPTPVYFIGVGEGGDDLDEFNAAAYARALVGLS